MSFGQFQTFWGILGDLVDFAHFWCNFEQFQAVSRICFALLGVFRHFFMVSGVLGSFGKFQ